MHKPASCHEGCFLYFSKSFSNMLCNTHIRRSALAIIGVVAVLIFSAPAAFAQSNPQAKKLEDAQRLMSQGKVDEAAKLVERVTEKSPDYGDAWDALAAIRYAQYEETMQTDGIFGGQMKVTVKGEDGVERDGSTDSLATQLMDMLNTVKPSAMAYKKFLYTMRLATIHTRDAWHSSILLRQRLVDVDVDSNVAPKALKQYNQAEELFAKQEYLKAAGFYKKALELQPDFYKAAMYLGDCYYAAGYYTDAIGYFKDAVRRFPFLLEPRKYLGDAYHKANLDGASLDTNISAMLVYPDATIAQNIEDLTTISGGKLSIGWTARGVLPANNHSGKQLNRPENYVPEEPLKATGPWKIYEQAAEKLRPYCDSNGIVVKQNTVSAAKYLEVYCWSEMLRQSTDPALEEARRMQQAGHLDCYVLVSCFHQDFYGQYRHFVQHNRDRIIAYYKSNIKH